MLYTCIQYYSLAGCILFMRDNKYLSVYIIIAISISDPTHWIASAGLYYGNIIIIMIYYIIATMYIMPCQFNAENCHDSLDIYNFPHEIPE